MPRGPDVPRWSRVKKRIFKFLAPELKGRFDIRYAVSRSYPDRGPIAKILIDNKEVLTLHLEIARSLDEDRSREYKRNLYRVTDIWFLADAYRDSSIEDILRHEHPLVRAFGMLDRRVGKRQLLGIDVSGEVDLVQRLYYLRCDAKGLRVSVPERHRDLTAPLRVPPDVEEERRYREFRQRKQLLSARALARPTGRESVRSFISRLRRGQVANGDVEVSSRKLVLDAIRDAEDADLVVEELLFLERETKLLEHGEFVKGVLEALRDRGSWIRDLRDWKPGSYNVRKQFSSLVRHLFAKYPVPVFMDKAWLEGNRVHEEWFKHIGSGQNIRTARGLPVRLTKRQAHYFMEAPDSYTVLGAIRWGQVRAFGGGKELADAVSASILGKEFVDNDFWLSVIVFLARHPMLDKRYVGPIIDYIWFQRYGRLGEGGVGERRGPRPNFSMRGRRLETLIREVDHWHRTVAWRISRRNYVWESCGIGGYELKEKREDGEGMIRIRELLSSAELSEESVVMHHCVATYDYSCFRGTRSIWTMERQKGDRTKKLLTIAVNLGDREITEVRGFANRFPREEEMRVIREWAAKEGLKISPYVEVE